MRVEAAQSTRWQHDHLNSSSAALQALVPHQVDTTSHFDAPDGLSTSSYRDTLLASKFVLAPLGHVNLDTFRLYEALVRPSRDVRQTEAVTVGQA